KTVTYTVKDNAPPKFTTPALRVGTVGAEYNYLAGAIDPNPGETGLLKFEGLITPSYTSFGTDKAIWPQLNYTVHEDTGVVN
ncbi:hypothetical protein, partial [Priestia megaterium]|uniref:hypothetical protein n=1 Tax=Priestia megaterium TaxID=1404 RepID=UPI0035B640FD